MNVFRAYTNRRRRSFGGRWRRLIFTLGLCVASGSSLGAETPTVKLTGIARVEGQPKALLEFTYPRFVFAVDASAVPLLNEVPIQRKLAPSDATTKVPAAELKLSEVDLKTALSVYGGLTGRVPLALDTVPNVKMWYRSQTELTRAEAIYALDSLVAINNIAFEWVDDRAVKAVPRPVFVSRSQRK